MMRPRGYDVLVGLFCAERAEECLCSLVDVDARVVRVDSY